jgi:hypothetical protein
MGSDIRPPKKPLRRVLRSLQRSCEDGLERQHIAQVTLQEVEDVLCHSQMDTSNHLESPPHLDPTESAPNRVEEWERYVSFNAYSLIPYRELEVYKNAEIQ